MYFDDLSAYTYQPIPSRLNNLPVVNVGWMEPGFRFPRGFVSRFVLNKLRHACLNSVMYMRGYHSCDFKFLHAGYVFSRVYKPIHIHVEGVSIELGSAELWLEYSGFIYAAPNLIVHYISHHFYKPPQVFVDAVLHGRFLVKEDLR